MDISEPDWVVRLRVEAHDLDEKLTKLRSFMKSDAFYELGTFDKGLLKAQEFHMQQYGQILHQRLSAQRL